MDYIGLKKAKSDILDAGQSIIYTETISVRGIPRNIIMFAHLINDVYYLKIRYIAKQAKFGL